MLPDSIVNKDFKLDNSIEVSNHIIFEFENEFKCTLPELFKSFLQKYGAKLLYAEISLLEPTPFGQVALPEIIFGFFNNRNTTHDIRRNTQISEGWPVAIPFAADGFGNWFYLYLGSDNTQSKVYFYDIQNRAAWSDEQFHALFQRLDPEIINYLELRTQAKLPRKEEGLEDFYLVSETFLDFINGLKPHTL